MSPKVRCIVLLGTCLSGTFRTVSQIRSVVKAVEYMKDEMATRPGVPMFKTHKVLDSSSLFNIGMSPHISDNSNCLVMYKLYRADEKDIKKSQGAKAWGSKVILKEMRVRTITDAINKMDDYLGDVFPHKLPENQRILGTVPSVCSNLSSMALPHLKK